mmetsp:Transcript_234/g.475  ORF Transcript_234/g.475 Transcript_234/m.475 type:complete len:278 (-) Transcript_234:681-1514(-)|eukprot:CAMPEP_0196654750 /NCGR_PEP_ID=MMETSP1086-20130531/4475_1 /TAXON_ID=77921 /ORGANISM="Cyanoptyche  gloeocystis , Strain SAG4.97" /LENGTH=277 /DNA_ID=CAMNT_0041986683 /DNA_START=85 /DNA_END=918 /DNA_ORIENTATION=+
MEQEWQEQAGAVVEGQEQQQYEGYEYAAEGQQTYQEENGEAVENYENNADYQQGWEQQPPENSESYAAEAPGGEYEEVALTIQNADGEVEEARYEDVEQHEGEPDLEQDGPASGKLDLPDEAAGQLTPVGEYQSGGEEPVAGSPRALQDDSDTKQPSKKSTSSEKKGDGKAPSQKSADKKASSKKGESAEKSVKPVPVPAEASPQAAAAKEALKQPQPSISLPAVIYIGRHLMETPHHYHVDKHCRRFVKRTTAEFVAKKHLQPCPKCGGAATAGGS